jgi:hypothetical protein
MTLQAALMEPERMEPDGEQSRGLRRLLHRGLDRGRRSERRRPVLDAQLAPHGDLD